MHFCKVEDVDNAIIVNRVTLRSDSRKIVCVENNQIFDSITEAEKKYNCKNILKCCNNWKFTSHGFHWCFLDDLEKFKPLPQIERRKRNAKRIQCVESHLIYDSIAEASRSINRDPSSLCEAIKNKTKCGGYHWKYVS